MPFKKKSISHCIFKFTHIYLQIRFVFPSVHVWRCLDVCVIFSNSTEKKKKTCTFKHLQTIEALVINCSEKLHHAAPAVHNPVMFI